MKFLLHLLVYAAIVGLFLYSKLLPHKDRLANQYKSIFNFFDRVFSPILNFFRKFMKPAQVGYGLAVDMSQLLLLIILLMLYGLFR